MAKHAGCYSCGEGQSKALVSVAVIVVNAKGERNLASVALCDACRSKPLDKGVKHAKREQVMAL